VVQSSKDRRLAGVVQHLAFSFGFWAAYYLADRDDRYAKGAGDAAGAALKKALAGSPPVERKRAGRVVSEALRRHKVGRLA
jgi:hypothetical protein